MAEFATVGDIERMLPWKFSTMSSPTIGMVEDCLARHSAAVSTMLRAKGVAAPDRGSDGYRYCQLLVVYRVVAEILRYRAVEGSDQNLAQLATYYDTLAQQLQEKLEANPQAFASVEEPSPP